MISDKHEEQQSLSSRITNSPAPDVARPINVAATSEARDDGDATLPRHLFTMTVDQVASELLTYGVYRDIRTIQRWCKAGKLRAILDDENGTRLLIDPTSVRDMVSALKAEEEEQRRHVARPSRPVSDGDNVRHLNVATARPAPKSDLAQMDDNTADVAAASPARAATSEERRDTDAALTRRIKELETEIQMLKIDKGVREQLVDYMTTQFEGMVNRALEDRQKVGRLEAENAQLRTLLPEGDRTQVAQSARLRFSPRQIDDEGVNTQERPGF